MRRTECIDTEWLSSSCQEIRRGVIKQNAFFFSELSKQKDAYNHMLETKTQEIQQLQLENDSLNQELNDLKQQLDVKVHSLKDKLVDNENLTEKLKKTYECQIDNLNMMITKLTNYLKEKTSELETVRNEKEKLQHTIEENNTGLFYIFK